ncbi:MAG: hypothetical protein WC391_07740 [Methanoregula sp.]
MKPPIHEKNPAGRWDGKGLPVSWLPLFIRTGSLFLVPKCISTLYGMPVKKLFRNTTSSPCREDDTG